jgi:hypothetical protein
MSFTQLSSKTTMFDFRLQKALLQLCQVLYEPEPEPVPEIEPEPTPEKPKLKLLLKFEAPISASAGM